MRRAVYFVLGVLAIVLLCLAVTEPGRTCSKTNDCVVKP